MKLYMKEAYYQSGLNKVLFCLLLLLPVACSVQNQEAESALKLYLQNRLSGKVLSKADILVFATGKYHADIDALSEEEFKKFENLEQIKQDSFQLLSTTCKGEVCFLTYSLGYSTHDKNKKLFVSKVEKTAEMRRVDGKWKIADISHLKTMHESLEPIRPLQE